MDSKTDIKLLADDNHYYGDTGNKYLSNSDIKDLLTNPKNFKTGTGDELALLRGRVFHQLMLEPDKVKDIQLIKASTRSTKIYKDAISKVSDEILLLEHEMESIKVWVETMQMNLDFYDLIYQKDNQYEVPAISQIDGYWWKGKADIVTNDYIIDLKTTSDINKFPWSARTFNYDSQAWLYQYMFGLPMMFLVIDKETLQLGKFECSPDFLERGREKVIRAEEQWERFFGPNATEDVDNYFINTILY